MCHSYPKPVPAIGRTDKLVANDPLFQLFSAITDA